VKVARLGQTYRKATKVVNNGTGSVDSETPISWVALLVFWLGLSDPSAMTWKLFSREQSVVLASSNRFASWSSRTNPNPVAVVLRRLRIWRVNWS